MEIPTVKSFCCLNLKTVGLLFGFFQAFIYGVVMLIYLYFRGHLLIPIILMPIAMSISWIYGIQEKKPMMMLPAMIPFVPALLACVCFVAIYPIGVTLFACVNISEQNVCTSYDGPVSTSYSYVHSSSQSCTSIYYIRSRDAGLLLSMWIVGCVISCIVVYFNIVLYSVYKFVEDEYKRNNVRLPTSDTNQNIDSRA